MSKELRGRIYGSTNVQQVLETYPEWKDRFWPKIDKTSFCWFWKAGTNDRGYGVFATNAKRGDTNFEYAHRLTWILANKKEIPEGHVIDHECFNPTCCNPEHLEAIPAKDNCAQHVRHKQKPMCKKCGTQKHWVGKKKLNLVCSTCLREYQRSWRAKKRLEKWQSG